jgi:hypothetical protein
MLSDGQRDLIRRRGVATLHDYGIISPLSGEAFLQDGVLAYYDGRMLLVCAQPFRSAEAAPAAAARALIDQFVEQRGVDSILYIGPQPLRLAELRRHGFFDDGVQKRRPRSAELFLPVADAGRVYRRATRNGFVARHRTGGMIDANHLVLAEKFYSGLELSEYLAELAASLPLTMTSPDIAIIEAWEHGRLRGFVTVHEPFESLSVALFIAHDRATPGVCDFLYAQLLDHARAKQSEFVNVGPSPTEGHYRFKRKWRGIPLVPPYYAATWRRRGTRCARHRTWLLRILGRN